MGGETEGATEAAAAVASAIEQWALPVAVVISIVTLLTALLGPWLVWHWSSTWKRLRVGLAKLRAYAVKKDALAVGDSVAASDIMSNRHLNGSVLLASHIHPSAVSGLKQVQRDAVSQFLVYLLVLGLLFVGFAAQHGEIPIKSAFSAVFIGADMLMVIRLFDRYRTLSEQIEAHDETLRLADA